MLTRSKVKALAQERTTIIVSPSATGQGTHTRWCYPKGYMSSAPIPRAASLVPNPSSTQVESDSESSSSDSSFSSLSTLSPISPDSSFEISISPPSPPSVTIPATPSQQRTIMITPNTPKKLQRSPPAIQKWIEAPNGAARIVLVPDSFTEEDIRMRETMLELKLTQIAERELDILMSQRRHHPRFGSSDSESDCMDVDSDDDAQSPRCPSNASSTSPCVFKNRDSSFVREATEPLEDPCTLKKSSNRLGPQGTELIDEKTFRPRAPVYPEEWRRAVLGQPTERWIE